MTEAERITEMNNLASTITQQIIDGLKEAVKCCVHCESFNEQAEVCHDKRNCPQQPGRPPARIIAFGCDYFSEKVPF